MLKKFGIVTFLLFVVYSSLFSQNQTSTMTGNDGKVYKTVKIGNQWWMAENLRETQYRDNSVIPNVSDKSPWLDLSTGAICAYDNNDTTAETYGYLYNWYAVNDNRMIAPSGWHVPTNEEWKELEMYLGMSRAVADNFNWRGNDEGGKLKETGTTHWISPNTGATNESGFSALPGGCRIYSYRNPSTGHFYSIGDRAYFWSSTEAYGNYAWRWRLNCDRSEVHRYYEEKQDGYSVRLVKD